MSATLKHSMANPGRKRGRRGRNGKPVTAVCGKGFLEVMALESHHHVKFIQVPWTAVLEEHISTSEMQVKPEGKIGGGCESIRTVQTTKKSGPTKEGRSSRDGWTFSMKAA